LTVQARAAVAAGATTVVAAGGDGTVSAVAHALIGAGAALGVLPLGTLNHFARDVGIPLDLDLAVAAIVEGATRRIDTGEVNDRCFINNASIGLYPTLVRDREHQRRLLGRRKYTAMTVSIWRVVRDLPQVRARIEIGERTFERLSPFVFVGNNQYLMRIIPLGTRPRLDGGRLWLYVPAKPWRTGILRLFLFALFRRAHEARDLHALAVTEATIRSRHPRLDVAIDGEVARLRTPLRFRILPQSLRVVVPGAER
jgi:diacylglycerol kinase family enzyme